MSNNKSDKPAISQDPWFGLRQFTPARIALGRTGMSLSTRACLDFQLAHALARDAVNIPLDFVNLEQRLHALGYSTLLLESQADTLGKYLQRPDLGRLLNESSTINLRQSSKTSFDAAIVVVDGLSSTAIDHHAEPFLGLLLPELQTYNFRLPPVHLVKHGRVAIGDVIAEHYDAKHCIVLIGERPGLSSPDSMGIYFTYRAKSGISTDADRNCISNIHANGLSYDEALEKLLFLINASEKLGFSGVNLKDETSGTAIENQQQYANFFLD